ncbi:Polyneuridine-aldehyde esterase precursor, putative [Ricinus communis]|uniref:Polyneuridine-aldehyde esterase, putative n=2 Tax=Ricinus communis TaxID=3988 RepID=B9S8M3_RICCO|nr:Polyneuridine-aldehyde esterase precursor, putative [Ricinus communis]|eukprot:XP_002522342.1 methylesterase 10 [Ricinus communis]
MLKLAGHHVTALDLGASGIDPRRLDEITYISDYSQPLMEFMASLPQDTRIVLVGHSYAGLCISLAMENFPEKILVAVFVSAYMPSFSSPPGNLIQEYFKRTSAEPSMDCQFTFAKGIENPPTSAIFGPEYMKIKMYQYCKPEDLELAKMLIRPTGLFYEDFANNSMLTEVKFGSVCRAFIVCEEDEVMTEEFQQFMIKNSPPQEVKVIKEAGHMVMLSKPKELCLCMEEIADKYSK